MHRGALWLVSLLLLGGLAGCLQDGEQDEEDDPDPGFPPFPGGGNDTVVWGDREGAVVRPGAPIEGGCVFNWLFTDENGGAYVGTAAHCTDLLARVRAGESGEVVGTVVFDSEDVDRADPRLDFSLIELDRSAVRLSHPAMLGFDGPGGVVSSSGIMAGDAVGFYGHGQVFGDEEATRDRTGVVVSVDEQEYRADMPATSGDSGAPVLHLQTGQALGMVSRFGIMDVLEQQVPTTDVGPLMEWVLQELATHGFDLELATV